MSTTSRGLSCRLAVAVTLAVLCARSSFAQTFSTECSDHSTELDENQAFVDARESFQDDNGLCFTVLLVVGGDVDCTNQNSVYEDECKNLDTRINDRRLKYCSITVTGTAEDHTFQDGTSNYTVTLRSCLAETCANSNDIEAHVLSVIPEALAGQKDIVFDCVEFFDPVAAVWDEYWQWIVAGIVVIVLICFCGVVCCWLRQRQAEKEKVQDPTILFGPNLAYQTQQSPPPQQTEYEDEEESTDSEPSSEEDDLETGEEEETGDEETDEETDGSSYHPAESDMEMSRVSHSQQPITTDEAMERA